MTETYGNADLEHESDVMGRKKRVNALLPMLEKAIGLLKGVTKVSVRKENAKPKASAANELPQDIQDLIGIASGIDRHEIETDERLSYLLNK